MMLLDELIQMMIGMTDDQLRKIKSFILMKLSIRAWSNYVSSMIAGMSLRDAESICKIIHKTAFYWRHKVMASLNDVLEEKLTLQNTVEADETFFPVCYKGNHKFSETFVMPCNPRHRGSEVHKGGIPDEQVCVFCMVDNNSNQQTEIAGLGRITTNQLFNLNKVENGAILITDKASAVPSLI